ncbi:hypothetical protein [Streptomyces cavernae]|uniref:hypothetical protein n=1 Tax=Streptomyces cavernae TaxID=2259034 RepID=UPI000FEBDF5A|nr:hypothetical protein [Streptomyces cavernae]
MDDGRHTREALLGSAPPGFVPRLVGLLPHGRHTTPYEHPEEPPFVLLTGPDGSTLLSELRAAYRGHTPVALTDCAGGPTGSGGFGPDGSGGFGPPLARALAHIAEQLAEPVAGAARIGFPRLAAGLLAVAVGGWSAGGTGGLGADVTGGLSADGTGGLSAGEAAHTQGETAHAQGDTAYARGETAYARMWCEAERILALGGPGPVGRGPGRTSGRVSGPSPGSRPGTGAPGVGLRGGSGAGPGRIVGRLLAALSTTGPVVEPLIEAALEAFCESVSPVHRRLRRAAAWYRDYPGAGGSPKLGLVLLAGDFRTAAPRRRAELHLVRALLADLDDAYTRALRRTHRLGRPLVLIDNAQEAPALIAAVLRGRADGNTDQVAFLATVRDDRHPALRDAARRTLAEVARDSGWAPRATAASRALLLATG